MTTDERMTTKEARKLLRNLLVDYRGKIIYLPRAALSQSAQDACKYLIDKRGFRFRSTVI